MKKALALFLIPLFLTVTVGITLTGYSCKGMDKEKAFNSKPCCKDFGEKGCCQKESKVLKVKDAFLKITASVSFSFVAILHTEVGCVFSSLVKEVASEKGYWDNAPPLKSQDLYILYRSLII